MTGGPRDERRRRTEEAILAAARTLFAELGYDRTTIRGVAARAGVDPALVMQRFGSKEGLFGASSRWAADSALLATSCAADLPRVALADLFARFEDPPEAGAAIALLRACLTHETAGRVVRDEVMRERAEVAAAVLDAGGADDAALRGALLGACLLGVGIARWLLEVPELAEADRGDVERLLLPALEALAGLGRPEADAADRQTGSP